MKSLKCDFQCDPDDPISPIRSDELDLASLPVYGLELSNSGLFKLIAHYDKCLRFKKNSARFIVYSFLCHFVFFSFGNKVFRNTYPRRENCDNIYFSPIYACNLSVNILDLLDSRKCRVSASINGAYPQSVG